VTTTDLTDLAALYRRELLENVVPFWERHGIDHQCGGYFTCLDRHGEVYSTDKYVWLQGRAVWMFARLHGQVDCSRGWLDLATQGADFLRHCGRDKATGRVYFSLTRDGQPMHLQRKIYAEVFYQLAMTEMARATGRADYLDEARQVFWMIEDLWRRPEKLGRPRLAGTPRGSTLADPMVFLSMIEELSSLDDDPRYGRLADEMTALALRHVRADRRVVLENVGPDGEAVDSPWGRLLNPGHAIEMGWFLIHLARRTGDKELVATALRIIDWSMEVGWDTEYGGLYYFLDADGRPAMPLESSMKLWWPMTEALYGLLLAWRTSGDERYLKLHRQVHDWSWEHLRDEPFGEWFGYLDRQGRPTQEAKGGAYKGFFHLPRALLYSIRLLTDGR
jgi:N-acylglucosamine 2-epimerase